MKIMSSEQLTVNNQKLGPEALGAEFSPEYLAKICGNWGRPVKLLLMEQSKVAGIGNIYANEALWEAGISPMKRGREIPKEKISDLHAAIKFFYSFLRF
jgi:formamidopyrimidine-DNA glycosylase